jgi:pyruvate,water dikinase
VFTLDDPLARDATRAGAKAAALAIAAANKLPVLPGAVLTVASRDGRALRAAWERISDSGRRAVAVRSSSPIEDQATSSMAGQFTTVLDVRTFDGVLTAVARVRASALGAPMAVLVQPMCDAALGGVLFGVDPVTGRRDRIVAEVVEGTPHSLVSGTETASHVVLTRHGRTLEASGPTTLSSRDCHRLAALARDAERLFGGPQDIEWAIDRDGHLWLLQSRPVTTVAEIGRGPRLGPGPIAETFPDALSPLELDLWAEPLRAAIRSALEIAGTHAKPVLRRSPVVVDVGGRLAADLDLFEGRRRSRFAALDPRPGARRVAAAWRVGRLRVALPHLAEDLVALVDRELAAVPALAHLADDELVALLGRTRLSLRAVHGHEVLAGALTDDTGGTVAAAALRAVARGRDAGLDDGEIAARHPVSLMLVVPRIGAQPELPPASGGFGYGAGEELGPREALRLRARWLQELSARVAMALGERLAAAGRLPDPLAVRWLRLDELVRMVRDGRVAPVELLDRMAGDPAPPLPAAFRLSDAGRVVVEPGSSAGAGQGAGGGRGAGVVAAPGDDTAGTVLVVRTLEPGLASRLVGRSGLVAETGSVLSHLAILARELGVPTVVGVPDAVERFPAGTRVVVDGHSGEVEVVEP